MSSATESNAVDTRVRDWSALAFTSFFPLLMAYFYFVVLKETKDLSVLTAFGVGKVIQFSFPLVYVLWFERERLRLVGPSWRGMPIALAFALAVGASMYVLYFVVVRHIPSVATDTPDRIYRVLEQMDRASPMGFLLLSLFICGPHAFAEEYYWRWFVFGTMRRHISVSFAILLSSIGFMLHHIIILDTYFPGQFWMLAMPFSICVAIGGGVWAWIYERTGSLWAPWVSHALIDAAILGVGYIMLWEKW